MKTNKELALDKLHEKVYGDPEEEYNRLKPSEVIELIELASKPDWFYPSKGEFPIKGSNVVDDKGEVYKFDGVLTNESMTTYPGYKSITDIKAWTYLPNPPKDE